ncbi:MAG: tRNA lysidine(34) synthetase TilS [Chitinivibrionales bacterium]|nr:tRNA lysidine(34) synthetase TilS [Chitinivibrionales bacterium]
MYSNTFYDEILASCTRLIEPNSSILLAVSGGADSTALFHVMLHLKETFPFSKLGVVHINHGLRGKASDAEERFVCSLAENAGIRCHVKRLSAKKPSDSGIEEWARKERYTCFGEIMRSRGYTYCATAHTADDQAETVLMRLMRGTGLKGLCGILPKRDDNIIRPMLCITRRCVEKWLAEKGCSFYHDHSNEDVRFNRNRIRHQVLPLLIDNNPSAIEHISQCSVEARNIWDMVSRRINKWIEKNVVTSSDDRFNILKSGLEDQALACESIAHLFRQRSIPFTRQHVTSILSNRETTSGTYLLPGMWRYFPGKETILFSLASQEENSSEPFSYVLSMPGRTTIPDTSALISADFVENINNVQYRKGDNFTVFLDAGKLPDIVQYRTLSRNDLFRPLGFLHPVKASRYLKKQKIEKTARDNIGVLASKYSNIIWIPGVQIGEDFRITSKTTSILRISYIKNNSE